MKKKRLMRKSPYWIVRFAKAHVRLWASIVLGGVTFLLLPATIDLAMRIVVAWDAGIALYLVAALYMMTCASTADIRQHADAQDEGAPVMMLLTIAAAAASFGAIFAELAGAKEDSGAGPQVVAIITVLLSWTFTHLIFALHYAYEFYGEGGSEGGLKFPGNRQPDYWDFVYFAFVVGTTFQTSDVDIEARNIRRMVAAHGVLSFLFNTTIVALTVNMAANAV